MSRFELKPRAFVLRKSGRSILDISRLLGVSKSTASLWCRDLELTPTQQLKLHEKMKRDGLLGRQKGAEANRQKKIVAQKSAKDRASKLMPRISRRDRLIAGVALYWAEGSKASTSTRFILVNSDPLMIKFMHDWLIECMGIHKEDITAQVSINEVHRYRIEAVLNFWSHLLDLPLSSFSKTFFAKTVQKKVYQNHSVHYGVLRLSVRRGTFLKYTVLQMIEILKADVAQVVRASHS